MTQRQQACRSKVVFPLVLAVSVMIIVIGQSKSLSRFSRSIWKDKMELLFQSNENSQTDKQVKDGWHTIQVFYGNSSLLNLPKNSKWFSQKNQDKIVSSLLRNKMEGYFIDLAAHHAVSLSNTLALERQFGWKGKSHTQTFHDIMLGPD